MGIFARASKKLNRWMGSEHPHLTICAELWLKDRKRLCLFVDALMLIIWLEKNHCKNQYFTYGGKPDHEQR